MDRVEASYAGIAELVALPLPDSDEGLLVELVAAHRAQAHLAARTARLMTAAQARGVYKDDGSKTLSAWLARETGASKAVIQGQVRMSQRLGEMPETMDALSAAEIGQDKVEVLGRAASSPREVVREAFARDEQMLVGFAKELQFPDFLRAMAYWENAADPDGAEDDADRAFDRRRVRLSRVGGEFHLKGRFDLVAGTELETALERVFKELLGEDRAVAREASGGA